MGKLHFQNIETFNHFKNALVLFPELADLLNTLKH